MLPPPPMFWAARAWKLTARNAIKNRKNCKNRLNETCIGTLQYGPVFKQLSFGLNGDCLGRWRGSNVERERQLQRRGRLFAGEYDFANNRVRKCGLETRR